MTPSYCLSSARNTTNPQALLFHNYHLYLPRFCSSSLVPSNTSSFLLKQNQPLPKISLSNLRPKSSRITHPFAALSSYAEGEEGQENQEDSKPDAEPSSGGGMAQAFHISSSTASAISICIAIGALTLPFFMKSLAQGLGLKTKLLSYVTLLLGFYMAWNIGANDVANAMGTSVGSGALTLQQAVLTAAVLEFSGAFLMGTHVTSTMQKGILVAHVFQGNDMLLFAGLLSSLAAAGTWLQVHFPSALFSVTMFVMHRLPTSYVVYFHQVASYYGWPVSTTHCIIGSMVGFGLVYGGPGAVFWSSLARVISSWVISPVIGALASFLVYKFIRRFVYSAPNPGQAAAATAPIAVFVGVTAISFAAFPLSKTLPLALLQALSSAALAILQGGTGGAEIVIPHDVLAWGGFGIVAGLTMWGYRVIATIGKKITELTPTRGFAAEFAAASVVLFASKLGLPISATHTLVGAVMGVGFARGLNSVRAETVREIVASWVVTIPVGAFLSVLYTWISTKLLSSFVL
ncbi:hypothetical protein C3L33_13965, partial [Rhododendron williamsianum]